MNFNSHHFPVGTLFTLNPEVSFMKKHGVLEVKKIICNDPQSYIIETTKLKDSSAFTPGTMESFHVSHVCEIVKRGAGKVEIEINELTEETLVKMRDHFNMMQEYYDMFTKQGKKSISVCLNNFPEVQYFYGKEVKHDQTIDMLKAFELFKKSFGPVAHSEVSSNILAEPYVVVSIKRLKKWMKQNHNRMLTNLAKEALKMQEYYNDMMERSFDDMCDALDERDEKSAQYREITENSPGMDKLIGDLKDDPNEKGNPEDF